jgi:chaperone modulatory protein CbpM
MMQDRSMPPVAPAPQLVEDQVEFTLVELSRVCRADRSQILLLVEQGVLSPAGTAPDDWRFRGTALRRALTAVRLIRDLELNAAGAALALDLLDEIDALRGQVRRPRR